MSGRGIVVQAGGGTEVRSPIGGAVTFKVRGGETGGRMLAFEASVPPGEGPPLHIHANEDEILYVLRGEFRFQLGDSIEAAGVGGMMFVPPGTKHCFQNVGTEEGTLLIVFTPAGMERFFELTDGDRALFEQVGAQVGMEVVGPPLSARD